MLQCSILMEVNLKTLLVLFLVHLVLGVDYPFGFMVKLKITHSTLCPLYLFPTEQTMELDLIFIAAKILSITLLKCLTVCLLIILPILEEVG